MGRSFLLTAHRLISAKKYHFNHFRRWLILGLWMACAIPAWAADVQVQVQDSGSKAVDALVIKLVSARPAPFPSGYSDPEIDKLEFLNGYRTLQVSNAIASLRKMGPPIFPALIKHLHDDRYSYSEIIEAWDNQTVGEAVIDVLSDGHDMYSGYKWRHTPTGSGGNYLSFADYLKAKNPEKWAEWAKDKTKLQIQLDFIDWCVEKEKERGFTDEVQKKELLERYEQGRERVKKEYSNEPATKKSKSATN
jgi:hypothetical protein